MTAQETSLDFAAAIYAHDVERIDVRTAFDFVFIGAYGNKVQGKEAMKEGWNGSFAWFPDYRIEIDEVLEQNNSVVLFGVANCMFWEESCRIKKTFVNCQPPGVWWQRKIG